MITHPVLPTNAPRDELVHHLVRSHGQVRSGLRHYRWGELWELHQAEHDEGSEAR